jgi:glyoxylase I family protein
MSFDHEPKLEGRKSKVFTCGSTMEITQLDHASVIITDVERSRRFYRDLLGLREINKPRTFDFVVLWFQIGDTQLHLLLRDRPDTVSPRHFALRVKNAASARLECREKGLQVEETTPIPGADRFFTYDPDDNRIEIIQWLRPYNSEENARKGSSTWVEALSSKL